MASKEGKALVKKARDCIRNKEFKEALKHCKGALKLEKTNYNALVFVGVCALELGQPDQAQAAYKRAIETEPETLLAWQGLASLYEKDKDTPGFREDLKYVYVKLSQLYDGSDKVKWKEVNLKLSELYQQQEEGLQAANILEDLIKSSEEDLEQYGWWCSIVRILTNQDTTANPEIAAKLKKAYEHLIIEEWTSRTVEDLTDHYTNYIKLLLRLQIDENGEVDEEEREQVISQCKTMIDTFPNVAFPLEVIGKLRLEDTQEDGLLADRDLYEKLYKLDPSSGVGRVCLGMLSFKDKDYNTALQNLEDGLGSFPMCPNGWLHLGKVQLHLHVHEAAERSARKGLGCLECVPGTLRKSSLSSGLSVLRAQALCLQGRKRAEEAKDIYAQLISECQTPRPEIHTGLGEVCLVLGDVQAASDHCSKALAIMNKFHPALALQGKISFNEGLFDDAELRYLEAIELSPDTASYHFLLGKLYWEMNGNLRADKSKCLAEFLKAAKLDPLYSPTFLYLGHYYRLTLKDVSKASRCYQKSFDLDNNNEEAGSNLGDLLAELGEEDAALRLFTNVTSKAAPGEAKWAWIRLGLYYLRHDHSNQAITCFQNTLRADPKDRHCWECLGEAYLSRGSYTAALKAFTRASELDSSSAYSLYQMAAIKQLLCVYSEAVDEYQHILDRQPDYVPALKGLGEAHLCLARSSLAQDFNGRAVGHVKKALVALASASEIRPALSCLWKLIGDCCTVVHPVAASAVSISLPECLRKMVSCSVIAGKKDILSLGTMAYGRALKCDPNCASLWNDLGFSFYLQAKFAEKEEQERLAQRGAQVLKKGISVEPTNHQLWNTLGVVCASPLVENPELSQHSFIMSIKTEPNNVVAWTNLGVLYLKHGKIEPAHDAFKNAQALVPSYSAAWIGQASIAEIIGSEEAADLFRHSTELDSHVESSIGYAHWVCNHLIGSGEDVNRTACGNSAIPTLSHLPKEYRRAVLQASTAMTKYADRVRGVAGAYNMHGLLLEHQCLWQQAEQAYESATKILEAENAEQELLNVVYVNHARVLCSLGKYTASVSVYQKVKPLTNFTEVCGLALAFYMAGKSTESYQTYEQALQLAPTDSDKSCVLAALGMLRYVMNDRETAKGLLFKSSQLHQPCERGLMALCALGLVSGDLSLAGAALGELMKLGGEGKKDLSAEICYLFSRFYAIQGNPRLGLRHIVKAIHRHPDRSVLWTQLSAFITQVCPDDLQVAARCGEVTVKLQPSEGNTNAVLHPACLVGSGSLPTSASKDSLVDVKSRTTAALRASQKAVRSHPGHVTSWAVLAAAASAHGVAMEMIGREQSLNQLALKLSRYVASRAREEKVTLEEDCRKRLPALSHADRSLTEAVYLWSLQHTGYCMMNCGLTQDALRHCQEALDAYGSDSKLSTALHFLKAQISLRSGEPSETGLNLLQASVLSTPHYSAHAWQVVAQVHNAAGSPMAAELCYRQCLQAGAGKGTSWRLVPMIRLAHLALQQMKKDDTNRERWVSLCSEASTEVLKMDPDSSAARLIQGISYRLQGNARSAKRALQPLAESASSTACMAKYWLQHIEGHQ